MYKARILLDSISETGKRITTFEITFPRIVLAEFNTHRMFSRNSASSRAIPFNTQLKRSEENPFIPERFPINAKGMQPQEYVEAGTNRYIDLKDAWLYAKEAAIANAQILYSKGVHKQICNRLLESFMWHTVIVTATEYDNFFKLRTDENAQYEIRRIADLMYEAYHAWNNIDFEQSILINLKSVYPMRDGDWEAIKPQKLKVGEWHLPLFGQADYSPVSNYLVTKSPLKATEIDYNAHLDLYKKISVARCARVSYLTHDGKRDIEKDLELFERLRTSGHWSPFEHVATPYFAESDLHMGIVDDNRNLRSGNFIGFRQYRKEFQDENCTNFRKAN